MKTLALALAPLILTTGPVAAQSHDHSAHAAPTQTPVADPHAGHDMRGMQMAPAAAPAQTPAPDPHAGHHMDHGASAADPHAGHDMRGMQMAPAATPAQTPAPDPHAGHHMNHGAATPDPHAGHDMGGAASAIPDVPTSADAVGGRLVQASPPPAALAGPAHAADLLFDPSVMAAARRQLLAENGDVRTTAVKIDALEAGFGDGSDSYSWKAQGWTGGDINRFWWKTEGEGAFDGRLHDAEVQALYSRAVAPFWDVQAGVRQDFRPDGKDTTYLTAGVQGVAPYWFEVNAAAFLSNRGDLTARVEAEYDLRLTQKWILQPSVEAALSASDTPELQLGSGLTSVKAGLRLRYEIRKAFAPYVGVEWGRSFGGTADYARAHGGAADDTRLVVGIRAWF